LVTDKLDAQIPFQCIYLFIVLYMFRAYRLLPTSTRHCHPTRSDIYQKLY